MDMDDAAQAKTLAHELGHVLLHAPRARHLATDVAADATLHRGVAEVEAESIALMVGAAHGLDTSAYTIPYVSTWAASVPGKTPVEVVQATAERVRANGTRHPRPARHRQDRRRRPTRARPRARSPNARSHRSRRPRRTTRDRGSGYEDPRRPPDRPRHRRRRTECSAIDVDGEPHDPEVALSRGDLRGVLDKITTAARLRRPRRSQRDRRHDVRRHRDPTRAEPVHRSRRRPPSVGTPGINGTGFQPGEEIAIAYVIAAPDR